MPLLSRFMGRKPELVNTPVPVSVSTWGLTGRADAGVSVDEPKSLQVAAVWRAVNLIAGSNAGLPLKAYEFDSRDRVDVPVLYDPHPEMTGFEFWETVWFCLLLWGNAYCQKIRDRQGRVVELHVIHPSLVKVGRVAPDELTPSGKVFAVLDADNTERLLTSRDVMHIPGPGYDGLTGVAPIRLARQGLGLALAAEEYGARLFGSGSLMAGILQTEQRLDEDTAERLKARWREKMAGLRHAHEVAVLDAGAKFQPVGIPPEDAQFIETRSFQVTEVARWFGIPPHMLFDVERSTSWGSGIEQQSIGFVVYTLQPWLRRVEQRVTKELTPDGVYAEFVVEGLLRGDSAQRAAFYRTMVEMRAMNANEVRVRENLEPYEGGDEFVNPNTTTNTEATIEERIEALGALIRAGFEPAGALGVLDLPAIPHTGLVPVTVKPDEQGVLDEATTRAVMGRLARVKNLDEVDVAALVRGLNGHATTVSAAFRLAVDEGVSVDEFKKRLRALSCPQGGL